MFERLTRWENNDKDVADLIEEKSDFDGLTEAINRLAEYEDSQMIPEEVLKQKDENYLLRGVLKGINQCIGHAMIELEQGGKYDWNSDLEACNNWLKEAKEIIIETVKALERSGQDGSRSITEK